MGALEALLVLSSDWPGDSTLNSYWLNFHVPSKKPCRKLIGRVSVSTFMTKNFSATQPCSRLAFSRLL